MSERPIDWYKVAENGELAADRVKSVTAGTRNVCLVHYQGQYAAMDNHCPHQGGPLGEGSIERGVDDQCWIRCPWHGWDFDPLTGKPPGGHDDSGQELFEVDVRDDGVYVGVEAPAAAAITVSDVMAQTMTNWGVKFVFGMVGHSNLGLAEALRLEEERGALTYIGIRHESAAAFACSGYAKLSGRPAACLSIAGPGATNLLTGLWDAKVDRAPVLALTGQVDTQVLGPGAFQEIDLTSAFAAVSQFSQTVLPTSRHAELMNLALKNAIVHRDVSHLIFPDEVQVLETGADASASSPDGRLASAAIAPDPAVVASAIERVAAAKRPLIIVGYGARESMPAITALAERLNCPVVTTFKAKGQLADSHALAAGVLGRSGTPIASWFMNECDLQIVFGASFSNHTGIEKKKPTIQVDFERMALGKFHPVDVPVWGEIGVTVAAIEAALPSQLAAIDQRDELADRWRLWRAEKESRWVDDRGDGINSAWLFNVLSEQLPDNAVIAVDVGNNTYSFGRYFETKPGQRVLMSGYLGSIGFSFPAAMGAWAATQAEPDYAGRPVFSVSGDGGFGQYLAEFTTAVKYGMKIVHVLLNNSELGKISKEQMAGEWRVWQTSLHNPSFAEYAELCGGKGLRVRERGQLDAALAEAIACDGPAIVEVMTDVTLI
ncbi:MAG: thiamine pyrophosphate-dependent enzyme [Pseudomonadota bacterium]